MSHYSDAIHCEMDTFMLFCFMLTCNHETCILASDTDECLSNPCQHGARCLDLLNTHMCLCTDQYTGYNCERSKYTTLVNPMYYLINSIKYVINGKCIADTLVLLEM